MVDFDFLYKGLCGLANAHKGGTMAGHLGAAVIAGYFFAEDHGELSEKVYQGIEAELQRIIRGEEAIWFNAKRAGITPTEMFEPFPSETSREETITEIAEALVKNVGTMRQSGHNVIFAAIALRALRDHAEYATPSIAAGIRKLINAFDKTPMGRGYYGKEKGWLTGSDVELPPDDGFALYQNLQDMVDATADELIATAAVRKQGFGGLFHVINHAAAILEISRFGYTELAQQALPAHHHHIRLWRSLPDVSSEIGEVVKSVHDPREPIYWDGMLKRDEARLTHRIKTMYGFFTLHRFIDGARRQSQAEDAFLYLMA